MKHLHLYRHNVQLIRINQLTEDSNTLHFLMTDNVLVLCVFIIDTFLYIEYLYIEYLYIWSLAKVRLSNSLIIFRLNLKAFQPTVNILYCIDLKRNFSFCLCSRVKGQGQSQHIASGADEDAFIKETTLTNTGVYIFYILEHMHKFFHSSI